MFFKRIRDLREDHDMKQSALAKELNMSQPQYQLYESGSRTIPVDILIRLSEIYHVSTDYILGRSDDKKIYLPSNSDRSKRALLYFKRLNDENQDYILGEMIKLHREELAQESISDNKKRVTDPDE